MPSGHRWICDPEQTLPNGSAAGSWRAVNCRAMSSTGPMEVVESGVEPSPQLRTLRFVSAASLFDGHDAAINMIRRLLQAHGAEVVHLGHNRSVADIVRAAIEEDADAIAVSSYQG